jgi:LacI family transcriptional regulator
VALVVPNLTTDITVRLIGHIEELLRAQGYLTYLCISASAEDEARLSADLIGRGVDGVIVSTDSPDDPHPHLRTLLRAGVAVVSLLDMPGWPIDVVTVDRETGLLLATRHLLGLGRRRICFAGHTRVMVDRLKLAGYTRAMAEADLPTAVWEGGAPGGSFAAGAALVGEHLGAGACPEALVFGDDREAIGAIHWLLDAGIRVPEDVSVVGFNGLDVGDICRVPLTTMVQPVEAVARQAVARLLAHIAASDEPVQRILIQPLLRVRASCGARRAAPEVSQARRPDREGQGQALGDPAYGLRTG